MKQKNLLFVLIILLLAATGSTLANEPKAEADQGSVVRWSGHGTKSCGMGGKTWSAINNTCYYPIDMAKKPGGYEIARWQNGKMEKGWIIVKEKKYEMEKIGFPDDSFVHLSPADLKRHYGEQAIVKTICKHLSAPAQFTLPVGPPLNPLPAADNFGACREFNGVVKNRHSGIDYAIGMGNPVLSVADGTVVLSAEHFFTGNSVYVDHGNGLISMYFHMSEIKVTKGQQVKKGDTLGLVGKSGRSTGPHLHLGIRWHNARIDPRLLMGDISNLPEVSNK